MENHNRRRAAAGCFAKDVARLDDRRVLRSNGQERTSGTRGVSCRAAACRTARRRSRRTAAADTRRRPTALESRRVCRPEAQTRGGPTRTPQRSAPRAQRRFRRPASTHRCRHAPGHATRPASPRARSQQPRRPRAAIRRRRPTPRARCRPRPPGHDAGASLADDRSELILSSYHSAINHTGVDRPHRSRRASMVSGERSLLCSFHAVALSPLDAMRPLHAGTRGGRVRRTT